MHPDILLTHGYRLFEDPHELAVMKPYPPLGILYLSSHLKAQGFVVDVFDATFSDRLAFERALDERRPAVVGIYTNLMTRVNVLDLIPRVHARGAKVVLHGDSYSEAYKKAMRIRASRGLTLVSPYDDPEVIAGQGTIGLEILRQHPGAVDAIDTENPTPRPMSLLTRLALTCPDAKSLTSRFERTRNIAG